MILAGLKIHGQSIVVDSQGQAYLKIKTGHIGDHGGIFYLPVLDEMPKQLQKDEEDKRKADQKRAEEAEFNKAVAAEKNALRIKKQAELERKKNELLAKEEEKIAKEAEAKVKKSFKERMGF